MHAILFDLDGVIYQGDALLPGAEETVAWARDEGIPHLFLTNTSSRPRSAIAEKLNKLVPEREVDFVFSGNVLDSDPMVEVGDLAEAAAAEAGNTIPLTD